MNFDFLMEGTCFEKKKLKILATSIFALSTMLSKAFALHGRRHGWILFGKEFLVSINCSTCHICFLGELWQSICHSCYPSVLASMFQIGEHPQGFLSIFFVKYCKDGNALYFGSDFSLPLTKGLLLCIT